MSRSDESAYPQKIDGWCFEGITIFEYFFAHALAGVEGSNVVGADGDVMDPDDVIDRAEMLASMACDMLEARRAKANQTKPGEPSEQDPPSGPVDLTGKNHGRSLT